MATLYLRDSTGAFASERITNVPLTDWNGNPFEAHQTLCAVYTAAHFLDGLTLADGYATFESWTPDRVTGTTLMCVAADGSGAVLTAYLRP